ncbi:flagellar biosynthesis protein FlgJ [Persephonella atlantica]|uniref:Flagellar biosynthesis protein FlgJ n=1 Tax=Persephonella atlantica TaxID=2699429 RepID=A0ABS1GI16_9AQUI|nr:rod-binding protein [Persephonella atlantica]MBK3332481.1 flagellar biosynthesis protein FlgJ [Persephonella atlantica]
MLDPKIRPYWDVKDISQINSAEEVAKEFEAIFVRMILKEFRKSLNGGIFSNSFAYKMYTDMFDMQIAEAVSSSDKLGLKQYIMNAIKTYQRYSGE